MELQQYVDRIEQLNGEMDGIRADIREVFANAKAEGFSAKAIREVIKLKKMPAADRAELEFEVQKYKELLCL
ncbi:MAG: DUF2312 domain-containing protein [Methanobrevibacter sp.]|nr:DUF2312 domain-containing protein [Methanobrevibacter sp.]